MSTGQEALSLASLKNDAGKLRRKFEKQKTKRLPSNFCTKSETCWHFSVVFRLVTFAFPTEL